MKFEDLWLSSLHPCACGEEDKARAFMTKGLQDLHTNIEKYSCDQRC
jgi:hypothetical protein